MLSYTEKQKCKSDYLEKFLIESLLCYALLQTRLKTVRTHCPTLQTDLSALQSNCAALK